MQDVLSRVATLVIVLLLGFILAKTNIFTQDTRKKLSELLMHVTSPLLIIKSFQIDYSTELLGEMIIVVVNAIVVIGGGLALGYLIWRRAPGDRKAALIFGGGFPNVGYMGYPILGGLFGDAGNLFVALYVMIFQLLSWTVGIRVFTGKSEKWYKVLLRPSLIAIIIGAILFLFSINIPEVLYNVADMVGEMTSPLAMMLAGAYLADNRLKTLFNDAQIYGVVVYRVLLWPAAVAGALWFFHLDYVLYACCVIIASMPVSVSTVIFAAGFDRNPQFASRMVTMTTLLSMLSVIFWMFIVKLIA